MGNSLPTWQVTRTEYIWFGLLCVFVWNVKLNYASFLVFSHISKLNTQTRDNTWNRVFENTWRSDWCSSSLNNRNRICFCGFGAKAVFTLSLHVWNPVVCTNGRCPSHAPTHSQTCIRRDWCIQPEVHQSTYEHTPASCHEFGLHTRT